MAIPLPNTPTRDGKILYIDADGIFYATHLGIQAIIAMGCRHEVPDGWDSSTDEEMLKYGCIQAIDTISAYETVLNKIQAIENVVKPSKTVVVFTGRNNFRYEVDPNYKANRRQRLDQPFATPRPLPIVTAQWRVLLEEDDYEVIITNGFEADDYVATMRDKYGVNCIISATDKDVKYGIMGRHYDYNKKTWTTTTGWEATAFPYHQAIVGDSSDGITGIYRRGKSFAEKLLKDCKTEEELYEAVLSAYEDADMTEDDLIRNMRLLNLHQVDIHGRVTLWQPPI